MNNRVTAAKLAALGRKPKPTFILSRSTLQTLLQHSSLPSFEDITVIAPCDFGSRFLPFQLSNRIRREQAALQALLPPEQEGGQGQDEEDLVALYEGVEIPKAVIRHVLHSNISFEVFVQKNRVRKHHKDNEEEEEEGEEETETETEREREKQGKDQVFYQQRANRRIGTFRPLMATAVDGTELLLSEPRPETSIKTKQEQDEDQVQPNDPPSTSTPTVVGSMLSLSGLKMHHSSGCKTTQDFSKALTMAAEVAPHHFTLDLFFGLGYCSLEALNAGASAVVSFEKYPEVVRLASRNPASMPLFQDESYLQRLRCYFPVDLQRNHVRFWNTLRKQQRLFDSVIIDPPKRSIMRHVYSSEFLQSLYPFVKSGAFLSIYAPTIASLSPRFRQTREELVGRFAECKFGFEGAWQNNKNILRFRKH
ncbi:hypothetical protein QOT17_005118 [Balamuthia mandrillaris]